MRLGRVYLTVRDTFIIDALLECLPPSVQVLLRFVLDYLAPVPLRPPRVQPRRRPFERHVYHAARQFCSVPVGGGVGGVGGAGGGSASYGKHKGAPRARRDVWKQDRLPVNYGDITRRGGRIRVTWACSWRSCDVAKPRWPPAVGRVFRRSAWGLKPWGGGGGGA